MSNASWATMGAFSLWDGAKQEMMKRCAAAVRALKWARFSQEAQIIAWNDEKQTAREEAQEGGGYFPDPRLYPDSDREWFLRRTIAPVRGFLFPRRIPFFTWEEQSSPK